jgi:Zn-dependent protease
MNNMDLVEIGAKLGMFFVPFLFALCFHEFGHAFVAKLKGDNTAELEGRLSLNPLVHADPIGTWVLPIVTIVFGSPFFFGWAKPVPVNTRNLKNRMDMFWISLAGPLSNVLLALISTVLLGLAFAYLRGVENSAAIPTMLRTFISINLFLAVFNMIPIHPLDGGKIIEPFLPARANMWLLENQSQLSLFLFVFIMIAGGVLAVPVLWASNGLLEISVLIAQKLV